jgi:hypothetical protein
MRTTIRLDDAFMAKVKREAVKRGETLTSLVERGLRLVLAQPARHIGRAIVRLPICQMGGGTLPRVDIGNSADLLDQMEERI